MEAASLAAATEQLSALCTAAGEFGIPEPPGGWHSLEVRVHAIALGQAPAVMAATATAADAGQSETVIIGSTSSRMFAPELGVLKPPSAATEGVGTAAAQMIPLGACRAQARPCTGRVLRLQADIP